MKDWLNKCHFGDCREVMKAWPAGVADACITDPPYGDTSLDWDKRVAGWMAEVSRVLKLATSLAGRHRANDLQMALDLEAA